MKPVLPNEGRVPNRDCGLDAGPGQIHTAQRGQAATNTPKRTGKRKQLWLRLARAVLYRRFAIGRAFDTVGTQKCSTPAECNSAIRQIENLRYDMDLLYGPTLNR